MIYIKAGGLGRKRLLSAQSAYRWSHRHVTKPII